MNANPKDRCDHRRRRPVTGRRAVAVAALVAQLALGRGVAAATSESLVLPNDPLQGRLLFESKRCSQCHALSGRGKGIGPALGEGHFSGTFFDLGAALWNHAPGMSTEIEGHKLAWPQLSADDALSLVAFLYFIDYLGRPGDPTAGRQLFSVRGCSTCHTVGGPRATRGPDLARLQRFASPLDVAQAIWNHGPGMLKIMNELNIQPPVFGGGDLADLSAYIRQASRPGPQERLMASPGSPVRGATMFESKGCIPCHSVRGRGGRGGPDLARVDLHRPAEAIAATMWNHAVGMRGQMQAKRIAWPSFTTAELADLMAYLYYLPFADPPGDAVRGARVFTSHSCATCHATTNPLHPAPALATSQATHSPASLVAAMWNHAPVMRDAIVGAGRPWPGLGGADLRDLFAYLQGEANRK